MRNKKVYNNLAESILVTLLMCVFFAFYFLCLWFGVIHAKEGTDPIFTLIASTVVFGGGAVAALIIIVIECYGYWILSDDSLICKKLFRKRRQIKLTEISKVEKKSVYTLFTCKCDAYFIYSNNYKTVVLINEAKRYSEMFSELNSELTRFID